MSKSLLQSALFLTVATFISKLLGSVFRIPLQNIAGDDVFGIFNMVYPVYMTVLILSVAGIPIAISKLISEARADNRPDDIRDIFVSASLLGAATGVLSFLALFFFAEQIAVLLGGAYATYAVMVVAFALIIAPYMAVYRGFFQGYEDMRPTAISQVLEQLVRVAFILIMAIVLVEYGAASDVVAGGVMIGSSLGALASFLYLRRRFSSAGVKPKAQVPFSWQRFKLWSVRILKVALPICAGALVMPVLTMIDSVTVPVRLSDFGYSQAEVPDAYGVYSRGLALVQIAVVFASALILPLIPAITGALAKKEEQEAVRLVEKSMTFSHLTSWPAAFGLVALTLPLNVALFGDTLGTTVIMIVHLSAASTAFAVLTTGILQGMNRSMHAAVIVLSGAVIKAVLNLVFVPMYGTLAAAWSTLIVYTLVSGCNIWMMKRGLPHSLQWRKFAVCLGASVLMAAVLMAPFAFVDMADWSRLAALAYVAAGVIVGGVIFTTLVLAGRVLSREELRNLPVVKRWVK
ncbi:putative polysaccharide biosynthesis protein [Salsuginibacillus kocurii]|uniref:putative polysaccharide biosynthesis protein n=1 Tax=Salsuginibacillus kocurii TaxID=427078 RepID=UPI00035F651E|nr:polysaccharide biosynthesis protein [Salsuginibacillus kocurii]